MLDGLFNKLYPQFNMIGPSTLQSTALSTIQAMHADVCRTAQTQRTAQAMQIVMTESVCASIIAV